MIGLVIGAVAKFIMPGKDPGGIIVTMLIGVAGSFVATYAGRAIGLVSGRTSRGLHHVGLGAIVLLGSITWSDRKPHKTGGQPVGVDTPFDFDQSRARQSAQWLKPGDESPAHGARTKPNEPIVN